MYVQEAVKFFYHLWPKFVTLCRRNKTMFVELFFWKTAQEAQEIQDGYGTTYKSTSSAPNGKSDKSSWTSDEENELVLLGEEYNALPDEGELLMHLIMLNMSKIIELCIKSLKNLL